MFSGYFQIPVSLSSTFLLILLSLEDLYFGLFLHDKTNFVRSVYLTYWFSYGRLP